MAQPIKGRSNGVSFGTLIGKLKGHVSESKKRADEDLFQRQEAGRIPQSIILNADDVSGEYDSGRALITTLGGRVRAITSDDLVSFRKNIRTIKNKFLGKKKGFNGGIRARQVLDLSLPIDRTRAQKEIRVAVPASSRNGKVRFITNSGPNSDVSRHHVTVNFLSFNAAVTAGLGDPKKMANWLRKEPLKIECDCGRWRYWFRYIASIGEYGAGRPETGYPKIRNPGLTGVACKHIIRTMAEVESSGFVLQYLTRMIEHGRKADGANSKVNMSQSELDALAEKKGRTRDIKTTDDRAKAAKSAKEKKALIEKVKTAKKPSRITPKSSKKNIDKAVDTLSKLTPIELEAVMKLLREKG